MVGEELLLRFDDRYFVIQHSLSLYQTDISSNYRHSASFRRLDISSSDLLHISATWTRHCGSYSQSFQCLSTHIFISTNRKDSDAVARNSAKIYLQKHQNSKWNRWFSKYYFSLCDWTVVSVTRVSGVNLNEPFNY